MPRSGRRKRYAVSPQDYRVFIDGLEIESAYLLSSNVRRYRTPSLATSISFKEGRDSKSYEAREGGFTASLRYGIRFFDEDDEEPFGALTCTFAAQYRSGAQINDDLFEVFRDLNLPTNLWPYIREHVQSSMAKMGLPTLVLSAWKT